VSASDLAVDVLVALGVGSQLVCCAGLLAARTALDRLHYASAATTLGPVLLAAAVIVEEGFTQPGLNALLVAALLLMLNPVVVHATARVGRLATTGTLEPTAREREAAS
jgi:multisubunit Na+/H+ antiporter MnhG subunit